MSAPAPIPQPAPDTWQPIGGALDKLLRRIARQNGFSYPERRRC